MVADDRSGSLSEMSPASTSVPTSGATAQSASFELGGLGVELSASPGAARLIVSGGGRRDTYITDPATLAVWAKAVAKLLALQPATHVTERAEFRTPFLIDREGRPSIAVEGLVTEAEVRYRLLVTGAEESVGGAMTTAEVVRGLAEAAAGAVAIARMPA